MPLLPDTHIPRYGLVREMIVWGGFDNIASGIPAGNTIPSLTVGQLQMMPMRQKAGTITPQCGQDNEMIIWGGENFAGYQILAEDTIQHGQLDCY